MESDPQPDAAVHPDPMADTAATSQPIGESSLLSASPLVSPVSTVDRDIPLSASQHSTTSRRVTFRVSLDHGARSVSALSTPVLAISSERTRHDEQQSISSRPSVRSVRSSRESPSQLGPTPPTQAVGNSGLGGGCDINVSANTVTSSRIGAGTRRSPSSASSLTAGASLRLDYSARNLAMVPPDFAAHKHAPRVKAVDLSRNDLSSIPPTTFDRFSHLRRLNLTRNRLESLSTSAFPASYTLAWLDLSNNPTLNHIDPNLLSGLRALRHLGIANCGLVELPATIGLLVHLTQLSAFGNRFETVPKEIGELRSLARLDLSGNRLSRLPVELGRLGALEWLNLNENQLSWLPDTVNQFTNLREIGLATNRLESLPDMSALRNLTSLIVNRNRLTCLPNALVALRSLTHLDVSRNRITSLPPSLFAMPNLRHLFLQGNRLTSLPGRFCFSHQPSSAASHSVIPFSHPLPNASVSISLTHLDISNNRLSSLPWPLLSRPLKSLRMYGNPLLAAPPDAPATISTMTPLVLVRTQPRGHPPRLVTLALNAVLASQPMFRAARALNTDGHAAGQVSVRVFGMLRGDGVEDHEVGAGAWVPHRRCDECLRLYVTDQDVCEMLRAEWDRGALNSDECIADDAGTCLPSDVAQVLLGQQTPTWFTTVLLCPRVLPDHRDVPCEFGFCSKRCWAAWTPVAASGGLPSVTS